MVSVKMAREGGVCSSASLLLRRPLGRLLVVVLVVLLLLLAGQHWVREGTTRSRAPNPREPAAAHLAALLGGLGLRCVSGVRVCVPCACVRACVRGLMVVGEGREEGAAGEGARQGGALAWHRTVDSARLLWRRADMLVLCCVCARLCYQLGLPESVRIFGGE